MESFAEPNEVEKPENSAPSGALAGSSQPVETPPVETPPVETPPVEARPKEVRSDKTRSDNTLTDETKQSKYPKWRPPLSKLAILPAQLWRFGWLQALSCLFPGLIFLGLAAAHFIWKHFDPPIARYDALLIYVILVQIAFIVFKLETWRELLVICAFHLIGLALEIFKTHIGSWSYPDPGIVKLAGVPIFSGFMYASVGSYICQAFRHFDLRINRFHWIGVSLLAVAAYANFYTHHWIPDLRWWIAAGFLIALVPSKIFFTVGKERYWMPAALSFILIGTFLWLAENAATFLGAWAYPNQLHGWEMVHVGKLGSWSLLVTLSFVLVAAVKVWEDKFYPDAHGFVTSEDSDGD